MAKPTPKVKMIWTGPVRTVSAKRKRTRGDAFYATRSQARTFRALGWAADAPEQVSDMAATPESPPSTPPPPELPSDLESEGSATRAPRRRTTYRRRDIRADE